MKIKLLLLVGIGFMSFGVTAQTAFLYNKGLMSINGPGRNGNTSGADKTAVETSIPTTLYINGNFIAGGGNDAGGNAVICEIHLNGSQTVLTGDFIHGLNNKDLQDNGATSNVFVMMGGGDAGDQAYEGGYEKAGSRFVFRGTKPQSIKLMDNYTYGYDSNPLLISYPQALKGANYIDFPDLIIDNENHVTLVPELAAVARNLSLDKGRLIVDSRRAKDSDFKTAPGPNYSNAIHSPNTSTMIAHFMMFKPATVNNRVNRIVMPNNANHAALKRPHDFFGSVQVNLAVDDPALAKAGEVNGRSLIAMGSPYEEMRADYFFWNFLMTPSGQNIIGGSNPGNTMTDPKYPLTAGKAFVIGVDLRGDQESSYTDIHAVYKGQGIKFADRGGADGSYDKTDLLLKKEDLGKYFFSRFGPMYNRSTNIYQSNGIAATNVNQLAKVAVSHDAYSKEILNHTNVTIPLVKGYNYFSNPFTVPFDVSDFIKTGALSSDWGADLTTGGGTVTDRTFTNKVWVLDPSSKASGTYNMGSGIQPGNKWVVVSSKYRVIKNVGSTGSPAIGGDYDQGTGAVEAMIAPLQMFVLYANEADAVKVTSKSITLPLSKRAITQNALFLRSASATPKYALKDDFLFEIEDAKTKASDRVAIAVRTPQEVMTDAEYAPTKKMFALVSVGETTTKSETVEGVVPQTAMSTMYTKDDQGNALESNILGVSTNATTESVVLYVTPSTIEQNITLKASRLASAERVSGITLIDKVANKEFDLKSGNSYPTLSKPTDPIDRFTVRFTFNTLGVEDGGNTSEAKNITSYYANGTLTVEGFDDADFGSLISVYDLQGRRVAQAKVTETSVKMTEAFFTGAYIVKVVGKKSYAAKFLVK